MPTPSLSDLYFDEDDGNLFLVEDLRLRADALKHSVLPRLQRVLHSAIGEIRDVLGIEVLDDSIVSQFPNFRVKREVALLTSYDSAFVGIGGKRKPQWPGFRRRDGKAVQILPFRFAFVLTAGGLNVLLENGWLTGLDDDSFLSLLQFHVDHEAQVNTLCFESGVRPELGYAENLRYLSPLSKQMQFRQENRLFDNCFFGHTCHFPIREPQIRELIASFVAFFPVYDSYIQLAKGLNLRLDILADRLSDWLERDRDNLSATDQRAAPLSLGDANRSAAQRVRVMPAVRWQVFQRDRWKCVACGRSAHDDTVLQVDHILPRSLGGLDNLSNFQTLCQVCNLGKGNRDSTALRSGG